MAKAPGTDLDKATLEIARRMLSTPPKHHDEMKIGKAKVSRAKSASPRKRKSAAGK